MTNDKELYDNDNDNDNNFNSNKTENKTFQLIVEVNTRASFRKRRVRGGA